MNTLHTLIMPWIIALLLGGYSCHTAERETAEREGEGVELLPHVEPLPRADDDVVIPITDREPSTPFILEIERKRDMALDASNIIKIITAASVPFVFLEAVKAISNTTELTPLAKEVAPLIVIGTAGGIALDYLAFKVSTSSFVANRIMSWCDDDPITKDSMVESVYFAQTLVYSQVLGNIARAFPPNLIAKSLKCMSALHVCAAPVTSVISSIANLISSARPAHQRPQ